MFQGSSESRWDAPPIIEELKAAAPMLTGYGILFPAAFRTMMMKIIMGLGLDQSEYACWRRREMGRVSFSRLGL